MFKEIDFSPGVVTFNNYDINKDEILNEDNLNLTEDMLQVSYGNDITLDVGWYTGINKFIVYVIKKFNWEEPMLRLEADTYEKLNTSLNDAISFIKKYL